MQKLTRKIKILIIIILILGTSLTLVILNNNKQSKLLKDKVKPNKTNIAIYVCDEEGANCTNNSAAPSTGYYNLDSERSYCTNGGTITYNGSTKKITYSLLGEDECYVYLNEGGETAASFIASLASTQGAGAAGGHPGVMVNAASDHGTRYVGENPSNFVWFNCSNLTNQNATTCERWRIIGVFNEKYDTNNDNKPDTEGNLVKIIRNDSLGDYAWDSKQTGIGSSLDTEGSNDWSDSQLMMMLNPPEFINSGYVNESDTTPVHNNTINNGYVVSGGINIFKNMGSYFDSTKTAYQPYWVESNLGYGYYDDDSSIPENYLLADTSTFKRMNPLSQSMIATVKWYLTSIYDDALTTNNLYNSERNIAGAGHVYNASMPKVWYGKIGLIYLSDYGYATSGDASMSGFDRTSCLNEDMVYFWRWDENPLTYCADNDWLSYASATGNTTATKGTESTHWTISQDSEYTYEVWITFRGIGVVPAGGDSTAPVHPTLYLEPSVRIIGGSGTYSDPYSLTQ